MKILDVRAGVTLDYRGRGDGDAMVAQAICEAATFGLENRDVFREILAAPDGTLYVLGKYGEISPVPSDRFRAVTAKRVIHVLPVGDKHVHAALIDCHCRPTMTEPGIVMHHALDGREAIERAMNMQCSEGWVLIEGTA